MKKDVALMSAGIIAYLADKNGDYVGATYDKNGESIYYDFKSGLYNIERILAQYEKELEITKVSNVDKTLESISNFIKKKMIIFVITDLDGMKSVEENTIKKISAIHDIMFVNINDAYMTGEKAYDVVNSKYVPKLMLKDQKLHELEVKMREQIYSECIKKLEKYRISTVTIDSNKQTVNEIINLLERHRYASIS